MKSISPSAVLVLFLEITRSIHAAEPWAHHSVDRSSRGADGVKIADVNGDGLPDITTGWEEGGVTRVYLNPGPAKAAEPWPKATIGSAKSPEDAIFVDLDGDGAMDVVSATEGRDMTLYIHWAPRDPARYLDESAWQMRAFPAARGGQMWMQIVPMKMGGKGPMDLAVASKNKNAAIGWMESPADPRDVAGWKYHKLCDASWVMSLLAVDMDGDGDLDILASDRKGKPNRVIWLENGAEWKAHQINGQTEFVMFLDYADFDGDGKKDIAVAVAPRSIVMLTRPADPKRPWPQRVISYPDRFGTAKAVRIVDLDADGKLDLAVTCENANGPLSGVFYLTGASDYREAIDIGGPLGVKYDLIELYDLDGDGDLDVITTEERDQLGVVWYENPLKSGGK